MTRPLSADIFVIYKGEEVIAIGTAAECQLKLGLSRPSFFHLATPTAHRRAAKDGSENMVAERVRANELP